MPPRKSRLSIGGFRRFESAQGHYRIRLARRDNPRSLVVNLVQKTVSMSSADNHERSGDGVCQKLEKHPDWIEPATLIQLAGGWFLVY